MEVMSEQYQTAVPAKEAKVEVISTEFVTYVPKINSTDIDFSKVPIQKFRAFKSKFPDEMDETLARFLIGKAMDIEKATEQLQGHIEWRSLNWPIKKSSCLNELATGKLYSYGVDKDGRPLIIFSPRFNFPKQRDVKEMVRSHSFTHKSYHTKSYVIPN